MGVLTKSKHERFAQLVARGETAGAAYISVYGEAKGAGQSASRLLKNAKVAARIAELRREISSELLAGSILARSARLKALEERHALLTQVVAERAKMYSRTSADGRLFHESEELPEKFLTAPGASTGTLCLDWRGKNAEQAVWKVDTGLLSELRAIEQQIARERGEWGTGAEDGAGAGGVTVPVQVNVNFVSAHE